MPDSIGNISVPVSPLPTPVVLYPTSGFNTFPLVTDFTWTRVEEYKIAVHRFLSDTAAKTEQRFLLSNPGRTFTFRKATLATQFGNSGLTDRDILVDFWEYIMNQGGVPFALFNYYAPLEDGTTQLFVVRFLDPSLTLDGVIGSILTAGVQFIEVIDPDTAASAQTYPMNETLIRFPDQTLCDSWAQPIVQVIPVLQITLKQLSYPVIYISDRRCILGGQLYQARILKRSPIEFSTNGESTPATWTLGNADSVITQLAQQVNLFRADVQFSLYDVATGILLKLWRGYINDFSLNEGSEFPIQCVEGAYELTLSYPQRIITRNCGRTYKNAMTGCPYSSVYPSNFPGNPSSTLIANNQEIVISAFPPDPNPTTCDKGFSTPNGCQSHGMAPYFGGIITAAETIKVQDNTTGVFGIGRNKLTVVSEISSTIYNLPLQEVYCNFYNILNPATGEMYINPDLTIGFPINCMLAAGIDEGDFYQAVGIVSAGPIGRYASQTSALQAGTSIQIGNPNAFLLDGQPQHGWPNTPVFGLWTSLGAMPAAADNDSSRSPSGGAAQWFSLELEKTISSSVDPLTLKNVLLDFFLNVNLFLNLLSSTTNTTVNLFGNTQTGGVAHVNIRRTDAKGLNLDTLATHNMQVTVSEGMGGYVWTAPGSNTFSTYGLSEPVWIMANIFLRALGYWGTPPTTVPDISLQEQFIDVPSLVYAATQICDLVVPVLVGGNPGDKEIQYLFQGLLAQQQPLKDWLVAVANTFLGMFTISFGMLRILVRENSSAQQAFSLGNIILGSQNFGLLKPEFNRITGQYADQVYGFVGNTVDIYDEIYAQLMGSVDNPYYLPKTMNLVGCTSMSQSARIVTTRLREELSGYGFNDRLDYFGNSDPAATFTYGKSVSLSSTILALVCEPGMVCRVDTPQAPNLPPTASDNSSDPLAGRPNSADFRIKTMILNEDYSLDFTGKTTHRDNYALVGGPKPKDVASNIPPPTLIVPQNWGFKAYTNQDGYLRLSNFRCRTNATSVTMCLFDVYYIDESVNFYSTIIGGVQAYNQAAAAFSLATTPGTTLDGSLQIQFVIADTGSSSYTPPVFVASANGIDTTSSIDDLVTALAAWLNADSGFFALYIASTSGSNLFILDSITGNGGEISVTITGGLVIGELLVSTSNFGTLLYFGNIPTPGNYIMVGPEIMQVVSVISLQTNIGYVQVIPGQLGTTAAAHPRVSTSIAVIADTNGCKLQLDKNLDLHPGSFLVDTSANQSMLASYDPITGIGFITKPFPVTNPTSAYQDPRMWNVQVIQHMTSFPNRFFNAPQRAAFEDALWFPTLGIVTVVGTLQTNSGAKSMPIQLYPINDTTLDLVTLPYTPPWPYRCRTAGQHRFVMEADNIPSGTTVDAFLDVPVPESQCFDYAQASIEEGDGTPLPLPPSVTSLTPSIYQPSGLIVLSGTVTANIAIQVKVQGANEILASTFIARNLDITSFSTLSDVSKALASWLNNPAAHPDFSIFYTAIDKTNGVVWLQDNFAWGGKLIVSITAGPLIVTVTGFTNVMGITLGRRYAVAYTDGGANRSALAVASISTGPSGDASTFTIQDVPICADARVYFVEVYALPDGIIYDPNLALSAFKYIGSTLNGTTVFSDIFTEANLALQPSYPGPTQPASSNSFTVILSKNDLPWCYLFIDVNTNVSNVVHGFALDPVSQDVNINSTLINSNVASTSAFIEML
jgi:hypothetical protein